ncbi:hypothetical protein [Pleionea litopenaei]|uniref:Cytochrome oxidase Cu insertion factor (SCO1/SenC/PrrC family) n=1 Tax=Pleionea litopenaei TaxID=3070815 RepID=A0AA51RRR4_9GAMM|nr:hypothetical protein [Pleionea sp. HL-JVS1]WMS86323.1 hypothetical protein Q9312_13955 [Pleionea sp. HL-JVS1]
MDFNEDTKQTPQVNQSKNRLTLIALAVVFVAPVLTAYLAYFGGWFQGGSKSHGEIIDPPWHIDDLQITHRSFGDWVSSPYMGKWNWLLVINDSKCDEKCQINWFLLQQTHLGLAKNTDKNNFLLVLNNNPIDLAGDWQKVDFMQADIQQNSIQVASQREGYSTSPLAANHIYLVDPLGNIFMRYPLIDSKQEAPLKSKDLRSDLSRVLRFLDVSKKQ